MGRSLRGSKDQSKLGPWRPVWVFGLLSDFAQKALGFCRGWAREKRPRHLSQRPSPPAPSPKKEISLIPAPPPPSAPHLAPSPSSLWVIARWAGRTLSLLLSQRASDNHSFSLSSPYPAPRPHLLSNPLFGRAQRRLSKMAQDSELGGSRGDH